MKKIIAVLVLMVLATAFATAEASVSLVDISFGRQKIILTVDGKVVPTRDVTYTYDTKVVSIDLGIITPLRTGTSTIKATAGTASASLEYTTKPIAIDGTWGFVYNGKTYTIARFELAFGAFNAGVMQPHQQLRQDAKTWPVGPDGWEIKPLAFRIVGDKFIVEDPDKMVIFSIKSDSPFLFFHGDSKVFELSKL